MHISLELHVATCMFSHVSYMYGVGSLIISDSLVAAGFINPALGHCHIPINGNCILCVVGGEAIEK